MVSHGVPAFVVDGAPAESGGQLRVAKTELARRSTQ